MTPTAILALCFASFLVGVGWTLLYRREQQRSRYLMPVRQHIVHLEDVRYPRPGAPCGNWHSVVPAGARCPVCGDRAGWGKVK